MSKKAEVTCSFIGLGLIGGSIVNALRQAYPEMILKAYDKDRNGLSLARKDGVISEAYEALTDSFFDCDYLFLCAPVSENDQFLGQIRQSLHADTILTDVGSVKQTTHAAIEKAGLSSVFIGGHPMAGSEKTGYQNANERLLENAYYILTPTQESPVTAIQGLQTLISSIGAIPLIMDYHTHDYVTAAVSHLPHIISAGLVNLVHDSDSGRCDENDRCGRFQGYYPHILFFACDVAVDLYDQYRKHPYAAYFLYRKSAKGKSRASEQRCRKAI